MDLERAELDELDETGDAYGNRITADAGRFLDVDALEPDERRVVEVFLKKTLPALPRGQRTIVSGRPSTDGSMCSAMSR